MKTLTPLIPTSKHLARLYYELSQRGARCVGQKEPWPVKIGDFHELLVLASEWSRFDPRLFDVLVEYVFKHWQEWNPTVLRRKILKSPSPAIWGVIGEFVMAQTKDQEAHYFFEYLLKKVEPAEPQLFFRGVYPVGSRLVAQAASESLKEYSRWGFLGRERPISHDSGRQVMGTWDRKARFNILRRLLNEKKRIRISDYLKELHYTISRQQALKDLVSHPHLKKTGKGRGVSWKWAG